jgi:hypothetical protein
MLDPMPSLQLESLVVDESVEPYLCWRKHCAAVQGAYERWREASARDAALAFAAYRATLDLEAHAAAALRDCAARVAEPNLQAST